MPTTNDASGFERVCRLIEARKMPEVVQSGTGPGAAVKVAGTVFAQMRDDQTLLLHCPHEQKVLLLDISPDIYFDTEAEREHPVLLINLAAIGDEELSLRLHDAWHFMAPEHLKQGSAP